MTMTDRGELERLRAENARLKMIICGCVPILRGQINNYQKALELIITLAKRALEEVKESTTPR